MTAVRNDMDFCSFRPRIKSNRSRIYLQPSAPAKRPYIATFIIIIAVYLFGLGYLPLLGPDEPRYAQVARELLMRGDPITPTLGGHTWFETPPLDRKSVG